MSSSATSTIILNNESDYSQSTINASPKLKRNRQGLNTLSKGSKRHRSCPFLLATVEEINLEMDVQEESVDITPEMEINGDVVDLDMPVDIGGLHREIMMDFSHNYRGIVLRKVTGGEIDIRKKYCEIHLSKKICTELIANEQAILEASLRTEMGEDSNFSLCLGGNFYVYVNTDAGYDVIHIRKIYTAIRTATSSGLPDDKNLVHSHTGVALKFSEIKYFLHLLKKVLNLLTSF